MAGGLPRLRRRVRVRILKRPEPEFPQRAKPEKDGHCEQKRNRNPQRQEDCLEEDIQFGSSLHALLPKNPKECEGREEDPVLFHQESKAEEGTTRQHQPNGPSGEGMQEYVQTRHSKKDYEVRGMTLQSQDSAAGRKDQIAYSSHRGRGHFEKSKGYEEDQHRRKDVDDQQPKVDTGSCLPEQHENDRIRDRGPRQFHGVGKLIRGDAFQQQLGCVGVFTFVPLQRHFSKTPADEREENDGERQKREPEFVVVAADPRRGDGLITSGVVGFRTMYWHSVIWSLA